MPFLPPANEVCEWILRARDRDRDILARLRFGHQRPLNRWCPAQLGHQRPVNRGCPQVSKPVSQDIQSICYCLHPGIFRLDTCDLVVAGVRISISPKYLYLYLALKVLTVCEGYVFTGVCLSTGGAIPACLAGFQAHTKGGSLGSLGGSGQEGGSRPTPKGEVEGDLIQAHTQGEVEEDLIQAQTQGGSWGDLVQVHTQGEVDGIWSRPTAKGEVEGDLVQVHTQGEVEGI